MTGSRPTMRDVAAHAGVSLKTVSRVVNREAAVAEETSARVLSAIDALGYRRNDLARSLRPGVASATIGLVIGDLANPFYSMLARAAEGRVRAAGSLLITASSDEEPELERELVSVLLNRRVDGLLLVPAAGDHRWLAEEIARGVHVVFVDRPAHGATGDTVVFGNAAGARRAVEHLLRHGHRRIAALLDDPTVFTASERLRGYEDALRAAGLRTPPRLVRSGLHDPGAAAAAISELLTGDDEPPDALFAGNNRITVGALRGMQAAGRFLEVVGFDDFELADVLGLTVVRGDPAALGRAAIERLFARMAGDAAPPRHLEVPAELVVREPPWYLTTITHDRSARGVRS